MLFRAKRQMNKARPGIVKGQLIVLNDKYRGVELRRIEARVEIEGHERMMVF